MISVENHYSRSDLLASILEALRAMGKDPSRLSPADLAPVDAFHIRGREATAELAARAALATGLRVLDVGCGLGGSARYLAAEHGCRVTGIDLTQTYVEAAAKLAALAGLEKMVEFRQCSALELPFADGSFDVAWTEHVQMNIADKRAFYRELVRVLAPGGRLVFHDVFKGAAGEPHYPVPWAEESSISFLASVQDVRGILESLGLRIEDWEDTSARSLQWFQAMAEKTKRTSPAPLGMHLVMGNTTKAKFANLLRNLQEQRVEVAQGVARKP
jgi:ubiquinone/menaquinone biosynthesis C-methylase UbiE